MGGGDKSSANGDSADSDKEPAPNTLSLEILGDCLKAPATRTELKLMAKLTASKPEEEEGKEKRAPVTICAAIDRSGSMKDHLALLKETLTFMVQQLRAEDKLSLITFDHEVVVDLHLTKMDADGKLKAEQAIRKIKERGHTNLSGGLLAAMETLYRVKASDASTVESVLLFTDGKANVGIRDSAALVKATKSFLAQINRQACVFTFGYGAEHDPDMLNALAEAGKGLFYYIDNSDNIPLSFCDCLGGLLSVAAQNVKLSFTGVDKVTLDKPLTTYKVEKKTVKKQDEEKMETSEASEEQWKTSYVVSIPDIYCEEERCILVKAVLPHCSSLATATSVPVVTCHLEYFDVLTSRLSKEEAWFNIVRNKNLDRTVPSDERDEIELHEMRCKVAANLEQANTLARQGKMAAARELLGADQRQLQHCPQVLRSRPLHAHLIRTVQHSLDGLEDSDTYLEHGRAVMTNYSTSHWQQRSNTTPTKAGYFKAKSKISPSSTGSGAAAASKLAAAMEVDEEEDVSPYTNFSKKAMIAKHKKK